MQEITKTALRHKWGNQNTRTKEIARQLRGQEYLQEEIAKILGLSQTTVSRMLKVEDGVDDF